MEEMDNSNQGEIVIYQTDEGDTKIDVRFVDDSVAHFLLLRKVCYTQ